MRIWICIVVVMSVLAAHAQAQTVKWSGLEWNLRDDTGGPGPNTFSSKNIKVEKDGSLLVAIVKRNNHWTCAELYTTQALGYGTYQFEVESRVDNLDRNVVLGLFSYPTADVGPDGTNEMDIEFARWGNPKYPNGNYTVWPNTPNQNNASSTFEVKLKNGGASTHHYTWTPGSVSFESVTGLTGQSSRLISSWTTPAAFAPLVGTQPMPVHINLWLFNGKAPSNGNPVEIVLKSFTFTPYSPPPEAAKRRKP